MKTSKYVAISFIWSSIAVSIDALIKFVSVPMLLAYFGKENFGLITLATSVNAYLQLLDMGVNTGSIKHFSQWIGERKFGLVDSVARTSISFYGIIGILNAIFLIIIAYFGTDLFALNKIQKPILQNLFLVLSSFAVLNWSTTVFNQLLISNENVSYVQRINLLKSLFLLLVIYLTINLHLTLLTYFILFSIVNSAVIVPFYFKAKAKGLIKSFLPLLDWTNFSIVFRYSLAIIAISLFSMTATKMRPIILGIFSPEGIGIVTEFRILETITTFIILIGGTLISIFLPKTSKLVLQNNHEKLAQFSYKATQFTSIICVILCIPFILNSENIITLYVGSEYSFLSKYLIIWVVTILLYLHNTPVASLVLSTGKTRVLIMSSAISCTISIIVNALLCKTMGSGSAVIGYGIYILIQMTFYYTYFINRVLKIDSLKVFRSFITPVVLGFLALFIVRIFNLQLENKYAHIVLNSSLWLSLFVFCLFLFRIVKLENISEIFRDES